MIKRILRFQHVIGDNVYHLTCDDNAPVLELKSALSAFLSVIQTFEKPPESGPQTSTNENTEVQNETS